MAHERVDGPSSGGDVNGAPRRWADGPADPRYRDLDHPADVWLEVRGRNLAHLAENALFALFDTMIAVADVAPELTVRVEGSGDDPAQALRALLAEALFLFDAAGFAAAGARVEEPSVSDTGHHGRTPTVLRATLWGEPLSPERHETRTEVKAVTHHLLAVTEDAEGGWRASVLLDV